MTAALRELGNVDEGELQPLIDWVLARQLSVWPKQSSGNPAMVNDLLWPGPLQSATPHLFGDVTDALVASQLSRFAVRFDPLRGTDYQRMLSVIMPGESIHEHADRQAPGWFTRIHIPLLTNPHALFTIDGEPHHMAVGKVYLIDTTAVHSITNDGITSRIHFMFDVKAG